MCKIHDPKDIKIDWKSVEKAEKEITQLLKTRDKQDMKIKVNDSNDICFTCLGSGTYLDHPREGLTWVYRCENCNGTGIRKEEKE